MSLQFMKPRLLPLEDLIVELEGEHDAICCAVSKAENEVEKSNYQNGAEIFQKVVELLSQHTIDEQRSLLGYLIEKLGRDGSEQDIEIMRGQTQIMNLVKKISTSLANGDRAEATDIENLRILLKDQFMREKSLFQQASSFIDNELKEEYFQEVDRFVNEGGK